VPDQVEAGERFEDILTRPVACIDHLPIPAYRHHRVD
jgi:hypothetical protein